MKKLMFIFLIVSIVGVITGCATGNSEAVTDESKAVVSDETDASHSKSETAAKSGSESGEASKESSKSENSAKSESTTDSIDLSDEDTSLFEPIDFSEVEPDESVITTAGIILDESMKQEILEQVREGSLDVENDTFEFENMTSYIGQPENGLITLIGAEGHPDGFKTKLFGEDVVISTSTEGENVSEIKLVFPATDKELLTNAIGEQLGTDPEEIDGVRKWIYLGRAITQQDVNEGICVTVAANK